MMVRPTAFRLQGFRKGLAAAFLLIAASLVSGQTSSSFLAPQVIWFPPDVPVFGDRIADVAAGGFRRRVPDAPQGLAAFVNEKFYPPLSTRLQNGRLSARMQERLDAFQSLRGSLINDLADQLVALQGADDETRAVELKAFADLQAPKIAELEREADEIRKALVEGHLLQNSVDWSRRRKWFIGETKFRGEHFEKEAQFQVVRAAAYYQDGLTPEQRGLLLEEAWDLQQRARAARPIPTPRRGDPAAMYFSPETARMRLPKNAPSELLAKIGRYNQEKNALKRELREAVFEHDRTPRDERAAIFAALADNQWTRFGEVEKLAEEIRIELAAMPRRTLAAAPHIPSTLMERIEDYNRDRRRYLDEYEQTMRAANSLIRPPRIDSKMSEDERVQLARKLAADRAEMRAKVTKGFEEATRERFEAMKLRYETIRTDLTMIAAAQFDPETGRPLTADTLLQSYSRAIERFDTFGREEVIYRGYRMAMLMPGLSPGQRRLLFGAALVGLAQPLPPGESPPTEAQPVPQS
jgi:hypothetical protein